MSPIFSRFMPTRIHPDEGDVQPRGQASQTASEAAAASETSRIVNQ
jgi:hypothetical protein